MSVSHAMHLIFLTIAVQIYNTMLNGDGYVQTFEDSALIK